MIAELGKTPGRRVTDVTCRFERFRFDRPGGRVVGGGFYDAAMPDIDIPADLLQLRIDFQAANAAWAAADDRDAADRAYQEAGRLAEAIADHPWWGTVEHRFEARMALIAAAKD